MAGGFFLSLFISWERGTLGSWARAGESVWKFHLGAFFPVGRRRGCFGVESCLILSNIP